ncbi:DUF2793 domain-containing protein [Brucella sp. IR073]|uniref:DUF2793 domain-containing protein n=1 Tax=unclassified Brucella TaxID=2632610 RepID=UPI003B980847
MTQTYSSNPADRKASPEGIGADYTKVPLEQLVLAPWVPVKSMTLASPPSSPAEGDTYLVPDSATGWWQDYTGQLAQWHNNEWSFSIPVDGHGISLPDGRVYERIGGAYIEKIALDVQSGTWTYALAGGTANALTASLTPPPAALAAGMMIVLKLTATNTGAVTLNVNGLGAKSIIGQDGNDLLPGSLVKGTVAVLIFDGTAWEAVSGALRPATPPVIYVRPDGNDANSGTANTPGEALQTIAAAIDRLNNYVLPLEGGIIQLGVAGTYAAPGEVSVNGTISIVGDAADPEGYLIVNDANTSSSAGWPGILIVSAGTVITRNVRLKNTLDSTSVYMVMGQNFNGIVRCFNTIFETIPNNTYVTFMCAARFGGSMEIGANCVVRGTASGAFWAVNNGQMVIDGPVTVENALYSAACATANSCATITVGMNSIFGSATGQRYMCSSNGVIVTHQGEDYLPGTIAGITLHGGQYIGGAT